MKNQNLLLFLGVILAIIVIGVIGMLTTEPTPIPIEHQITAEKFIELVDNANTFKTEDDLFADINYEWFNNESVKYVVNNPNAEKFVVAIGAKEDGTGCIILYGMDKDNNILEPYLEVAHPCPPFCDPGFSSTPLGMIE